METLRISLNLDEFYDVIFELDEEDINMHFSCDIRVIENNN